MENIELKIMDLLLNPKPGDRVFIYNKELDRDFGMELGVLIALLQSPDTAGKYVFKPVDTLQELKELDTANNVLWPDGWIIHLKGKGIYALDRNSQAEPNDETVITALNSGRWIGKGATDMAFDDYVSRRLGGTYEADISVNGVITCQNLVQGSDFRFKEDIQPMAEHIEANEVLRQMEFFKYRMKDSGRIGHGLIAQQLQELAPDMVIQEKERLYVDMYAVTSLYGLVLQDLLERVERLEKLG